MIQELFLTVLTKIVRGAPIIGGQAVGSDTVESVMGWNLTSSYPKGEHYLSGADAFRKILKMTPLDAKGISLLRSFLLSYRGTEGEESDILKNMIRQVDRIKPFSFSYSNYNYRSVYEEGISTFKYASFDSPSNVDVLVKRETARMERLLKNYFLDFAAKHAEGLEIGGPGKGLMDEFLYLFENDLMRYPKDHPLLRQGVVQEAYLSALTAALRGGPIGAVGPFGPDQQEGFAVHLLEKLEEMERTGNPMAKYCQRKPAWGLQDSVAQIGGAEAFAELLDRAPWTPRGSPY